MAGGLGIRFWAMSILDYSRLFIDVMGVGRFLILLMGDKFKPICLIESMWGDQREIYQHCQGVNP